MAKASTRAKYKYNKKTYTRVEVNLPKEVGDAFKEKCREKEISVASVLKQAVMDFMEE